ncbi:MAG: PQQ-dependent sugar dehydrogenase [Planctomycetes bacterium]|nr:PQQ-dependent sugar dehydrogenase [Planctomycetota bacterium]
MRRYTIRVLLSILCIGGSVQIRVTAEEPPFGLADRVPWTTSRIVGTPEPPPPYRAVRVFPNLTFNGPVQMVEEPGSGRLVVAQSGGKVVAFSKDDPDVDWAETFLEVNRNLYAISFHPNYKENGYVFIFSPHGPDGTEASRRSRVSRFRTTFDSPRCLQPDSEEIIIEWPAGGHNGGEAIIGADGYLYIATGDGSVGSDTDVTGQGVDDLKAVILRLDVDNPDTGRAYSIPPDNPFIDLTGARPEIWAHGFRNPWRMSVDPKTGRLWVGDVGQDLWEMIWLVERGGNYGWSVQEGSHPFYPDRERGPGPILSPIVEHHHIECRSITGGYVYEGEKFPELYGLYVYGDYQYGKIWGLRHDGEKLVWHGELADTPLTPSFFTMTSDGEILTTDYASGELYALERAPKASENDRFPTLLSETGLFASTADHQIAPGLIPYDVNAPAWNDGAHAERYLAIPGDSRIDFLETNRDAHTWGLVDGSVVVQTLSLHVLDSALTVKPTRRRLETRILVRQDKHWLGYTYLWNDSQTDAELVDNRGTDLTFTVPDGRAPDGRREQLWHVPGRNECMVCHSRAAGFTLGLQTLQMNRDFDYGDVVDNQLRTLNGVGLFSQPLEKEPDEYAALPNPYDDSADLGARARAYLYVNCSVCHVQDGGGNAAMQLRYEEAAEHTGLFDIAPKHDTFGIENARLVAPGSPYRSVLYYRMATLGPARMPRAGPTTIDDAALRFMEKWMSRVDAEGNVSGLDGASESTDYETLINTLRSATSFSATAKSATVTLLETTGGGLALTRELAENRVSNEVRSGILAETATLENRNVRDLFERFVPLAQRAKRLGHDIRPDAILAMEGEASRGEASFRSGVASQCKTCHRVGNAGATVGPDLTEIGKKYTPERLLESILNPSKEIDPKYTTYALVTATGDVITGLLVEKTTETITLRDAKGELRSVAAETVAALEQQASSLMPERLLRDWTAQEAADLLAYLAGLK